MIRALQTSDGRAVAFLLRRLRAESRYLRFHGLHPNTRAEVLRLTNVDHWHHEVLIALTTAPRIPIGVAEYVRLDEFDLAEVALAVADDWQRRGVGRALVGALWERAIAAGVRRLTALVLPGNRGTFALANQFGRSTVLTSHRDAVELLFEPRASNQALQDAPRTGDSGHWPSSSTCVQKRMNSRS